MSQDSSSSTPSVPKAPLSGVPLPVRARSLIPSAKPSGLPTSSSIKSGSTSAGIRRSISGAFGSIRGPVKTQPLAKVALAEDDFVFISPAKAGDNGEVGFRTSSRTNAVHPISKTPTKTGSKAAPPVPASPSPTPLARSTYGENATLGEDRGEDGKDTTPIGPDSDSTSKQVAASTASSMKPEVLKPKASRLPTTAAPVASRIPPPRRAAVEATASLAIPRPSSSSSRLSLAPTTTTLPSQIPSVVVPASTLPRLATRHRASLSTSSIPVTHRGSASLARAVSTQTILPAVSSNRTSITGSTKRLMPFPAQELLSEPFSAPGASTRAKMVRAKLPSSLAVVGEDSPKENAREAEETPTKGVPSRSDLPYSSPRPSPATVRSAHRSLITTTSTASVATTPFFTPSSKLKPRITPRTSTFDYEQLSFEYEGDSLVADSSSSIWEELAGSSEAFDSPMPSALLSRQHQRSDSLGRGFSGPRVSGRALPSPRRIPSDHSSSAPSDVFDPPSLIPIPVAPPPPPIIQPAAFDSASAVEAAHLHSRIKQSLLAQAELQCALTRAEARAAELEQQQPAPPDPSWEAKVAGMEAKLAQVEMERDEAVTRRDVLLAEMEGIRARANDMEEELQSVVADKEALSELLQATAADITHGDVGAKAESLNPTEEQIHDLSSAAASMSILRAEVDELRAERKGRMTAEWARVLREAKRELEMVEAEEAVAGMMKRALGNLERGAEMRCAT